MNLQPLVTAIVPAYNEEKTVRSVVSTLLSSGLFYDVIVIDDGSVDATASRARAAGATVRVNKTNLGKGTSMKIGAKMTNSPYLFFCDADIIGLNHRHLDELLKPIKLVNFGMSVGMRDKGRIGTWFSMKLPWISGERVIDRRIIDAVPSTIFTGYRAEILLNRSCNRLGLRSTALKMDGVTMRKKTAKTGIVRAIYDYTRMYLDVVYAYMISTPRMNNRTTKQDVHNTNFGEHQ